jgi:probable rRNA maturation factor
VTVFVADERGEPPAPDQPSIDAARWIALAEQVLAAEGVRGDAELSLLFVDEEAMARLNEQFMGATGPTDVLAFPIDGEQIEPGRWPDGGTEGPERIPPSADELPLLLGDVVICPAVAARNAPEHAGSFEDELALLLVHGVLHLLGHDHATDEERAAMQARERALLTQFYGPLGGDPWGR